MVAASLCRHWVLDLASDMQADVSWFQSLLQVLSKRLRRDVVHGLPSSVFPIEQVHDAFHLLKSGGNVGKVVVTSQFAALRDVTLRASPECRTHLAATSMTCSIMDLATVVGMIEEIASHAVSADAPLMEAGIDSLGAVELRNQLQRATHSDVPSTMMFDHPTARQLAACLEASIVGGGMAAVSSWLLVVEASDSGSVLLVGSSTMQPSSGQALHGALRVLECTRDVMGEVPALRWNVSTQPVASEVVASRVRHGGFVRGEELTDNVAFGISPAEAAAMDPCQRLILDRGYTALHGAKLERASLVGSLTGVFLGFAGSEFAPLLAASPAGGSVYGATGATSSIASGRLSYVLGLHGACASIDSACSSALTACHSGVRTLQLGECAIGLVASATLMLVPDMGVSLAVAGMTSARGRCHTFDIRADGYARGEACGGVTLFRVADDALLSVSGSAVRQDGRSASLTAPNGQAQQGLLIAALADANTSAGALALSEAHGTGTALGDPIEAGSLAAAVLVGREAPLAAGGVKANIGHAEPAAGMTGLLKLVLGLRRSEASPNAQLRLRNPFVGESLHGVGCVLPVQLTALARDASGGGVSSFGYSGTIVHGLLQHLSSAVLVHPSVLPPSFRRRAFLIRPRSTLPGTACENLVSLPAKAFELHLSCPGSVNNLVVRPQDLTPFELLEANQVELGVRAAGLNFRDVLNILDLDPTRTTRPLGLECASTARKVGDATTHLH